MAETARAQRVHKMNLPQFDRYLRDKLIELQACIGEIETIHNAFQRTLQRELEAWQTLFSYCYPQVATRRKEMPSALQAYLDRIEAEERVRLEKEIAELKEQIADHRRTMDEVTAQAQEAVLALRQANPTLNQREESLKQRVKKLEDEYVKAFEEMEALQRRPWAWLLEARALRQLKKTQKMIRKQQAEALQKLRDVRQEWLAKVQETSETQSHLRETWQQASIASAELQARHDYLVANLDDLARQEGLQRALREMTETFPVEGELGAKLAEIAGHNAVRIQYEQGIAASSETLGLLRGIANGLERFSQSVHRLLQQQRRYNLKQISIPVPYEVGYINQTWGQLTEAVREKEHLMANPLAFGEIARRYVVGRLTPEVIQRFFEQMGEALNQGTAAWG